MDHFLLGIALLCQTKGTLHVTRMLDTEPTTHENCLSREQSDILRLEFLRPREDDCEEILICVQVGWTLPPETP